jgi:quercetin dioxygenase-like cupin family protein
MSSFSGSSSGRSGRAPAWGRAGWATGALLALLVIAAPGFLAGCGTSAPAQAPPGGPATTRATTAVGEPVVKDVLADDVDPPGAPGSTLTLVRYTIAAGAELAPHVHPGVQMAEIDAGTLTYTIVSGTAQVRRGGGDAEPVSGPTTIELHAGDSVVEPFDMVHYGANRTGEPVVISATLLTRTDEGLSVPVDLGTATTGAPTTAAGPG